MRRSSVLQARRDHKQIYVVARTIFFAITVSLFWSSCSKNDNEPDSDKATFVFDITGALTKKVSGTYAKVDFDNYQSPASGNTIYSTVIALSSDKHEFYTMGVSREGKVMKPGSYNIDLILSPYFSSFANYTEDNGARIYGPESGVINISQVSENNIAGSFKVILEDAGRYYSD